MCTVKLNILVLYWLEIADNHLSHKRFVISFFFLFAAEEFWPLTDYVPRWIVKNQSRFRPISAFDTHFSLKLIISSFRLKMRNTWLFILHMDYCTVINKRNFSITVMEKVWNTEIVVRMWHRDTQFRVNVVNKVLNCSTGCYHQKKNLWKKDGHSENNKRE